VVYEIKDALDAQGFYETEDLESFKQARFRTIREITQAQEPQHKALYAATERPTRLFNQKLGMLREAIVTWELAFEKARANRDEHGMKSAEHQRKDYAQQLSVIMEFKSSLGRFCRTYGYVAQLIDFGDPELENFAAFARLLQTRLEGVPPDHVDLRGLVLSGFDIKARVESGEGSEPGSKPLLKPVGPGGRKKDDDRHYLKEIIDRLNRLFGDATPLRDQAAFVNHITAIAKESDVVMAQVENNTREQALKGNLPGAVQQGVVRALSSHQKLATQVLKADRQAMAALTDLIYELIRDRQTIHLDDLDA
jgi:type I restriction enzyme R subunit